MLYVGDAILIALCWYKMQYFQTAIGVFQGSTWWKQVAAAVLLEKETFIGPVCAFGNEEKNAVSIWTFSLGNNGWFDWHWNSPNLVVHLDRFAIRCDSRLSERNVHFQVSRVSFWHPTLHTLAPASSFFSYFYFVFFFSRIFPRNNHL